jgi:hypothetical protein
LAEDGSHAVEGGRRGVQTGIVVYNRPAAGQKENIGETSASFNKQQTAKIEVAPIFNNKKDKEKEKEKNSKSK